MSSSLRSFSGGKLRLADSDQGWMASGAGDNNTLVCTFGNSDAVKSLNDSNSNGGVSSVALALDKKLQLRHIMCDGNNVHSSITRLLCQFDVESVAANYFCNQFLEFFMPDAGDHHSNQAHSKLIIHFFVSDFNG